MVEFYNGSRAAGELLTFCAFREGFERDEAITLDRPLVIPSGSTKRMEVNREVFAVPSYSLTDSVTK